MRHGTKPATRPKTVDQVKSVIECQDKLIVLLINLLVFSIARPIVACLFHAQLDIDVNVHEKRKVVVTRNVDEIIPLFEIVKQFHKRNSAGRVSIIPTLYVSLSSFRILKLRIVKPNARWDDL